MTEPHRYKTLAALTWSRDFAYDPELRKRAHLEQTQRLVDGFAEAIPIFRDQLHPNQSVVLAASKRSLELRDNASANPFLTGYINLESVGELKLQFMGRSGGGGEELVMALDRYGEDTYVWKRGDTVIDAVDLPTYIVQQLINRAAKMIEGELTLKRRR